MTLAFDTGGQTCHRAHGTIVPFSIILAAMVALSACSQRTGPLIISCTGWASSSSNVDRIEQTRRYRYSASDPSLSFWLAQEDRWSDGGLHEAEVKRTEQGLDWRGYSLRSNRIVRFDRALATVSDVEAINEPTIISTFTGTCRASD